MVYLFIAHEELVADQFSAMAKAYMEQFENNSKPCKDGLSNDQIMGPTALKVNEIRDRGCSDKDKEINCRNNSKHAVSVELNNWALLDPV